MRARHSPRSRRTTVCPQTRKRHLKAAVAMQKRAAAAPTPTVLTKGRMRCGLLRKRQLEK
jgi:hypothetical protein